MHMLWWMAYSCLYKMLWFELNPQLALCLLDANAHGTASFASMKPTILLLAALALLISARSARSQQVKVLSVTDGDTCRAQLTGGPPFTIRVADIDAPELKQRDGTWSALVLQNLLATGQPIMAAASVDRYGRTIARLTVNGTDVGTYMVANGAAWHYHLYSTRGELAGLQTHAKSQRLGLWGSASPVPPWDWRRLRATLLTQPR